MSEGRDASPGPPAAGVIVVTGGSRGIGAATARLAAARGYHVCVGYLRARDQAEAVVADIRRRGGHAMAVAADVADEPQVVGLFDRAAEALGPLTVLVNNAGPLGPQMRVEAMSRERILRVLEVNVVGAFLCAREAVRRLSTRRGASGGAIVNVSSAAARLGSPDEYVDYAASKAAIDTLTLGLAKEVGREGIRVNAVRPGLIHTDIHATGGEPGRIERLKGSVPLGRGGDPDEVARAILWLASPDASYVTGAIVDVSGGR